MIDNSTNNKIIAKNTMILYLRMLVMTCISLYTSRVIFNTLGVVDYGVYNLVAGIIVFFSFINGGLSRATTRYVTAELSSGTNDSLRNVFNTTVVAHLIIAIVVFTAAEPVGIFIINRILDIPTDRIFAANIVYQLSVFASLVGIMQTPFQAAIIAKEKMSVYAYLTIIDAILKLATALLIIYYDGDKLIFYSILIFISNILSVIFYRIYCYRNFLFCKWEKPKNKELLKKLFSFMGWSLAGQGAVVATNQGVNFLINVYCGVVVNASIGISSMIVNIVTNFVSNFQIAFNPQLIKLYISNSHDELINLAIKTTRLTSFLILIFLIPISFQIDNILTFWLGDYPQYTAEFCVLTLIGIYFDQVSGPMWMIRGAHEDIKNYQIVIFLIYSLCFFIGWIVLYFKFPPYSVIIVRTIVFIFLLIIRALFVKKLVPQLSILNYIKEVFITTTIVIIIPLLTMLLLTRLEISNLIIELVFKCGTGLLITLLSIYVFGFNNEEKKYVIFLIKGFIKKINKQ